MLHLRRGAAAWLAFHRQTKEGEAEVISRLVTNDVSVAVHCCLLLEPQTLPGLRAGPRDSFRLLNIWLQPWKCQGILIFFGHGYCPLYLCEKFWCSDVCVRCAGGTQRGGAFLLVSVGMLTPCEHNVKKKRSFPEISCSCVDGKCRGLRVRGAQSVLCALGICYRGGPCS